MMRLNLPFAAVVLAAVPLVSFALVRSPEPARAGVRTALSSPGDVGAAMDPGDATYYKEISRLLQSNCVTCHRAGGIAPFALDTYEQVYRFRAAIANAVQERRMPPWFASPEYGRFANDRSLDTESRDLLLGWIAAGAPAGDPADAPPPLALVEGWNIGEPDLVLQMARPVDIPATGKIPYINVTIPTGLTEDRWVRAMEIRPTAQEVTHHILATVRGPADPTNPDGPHVQHGSGGVQGYYALMVPGSTGLDFGPGRAKLLPANSEFVFQLHYTANGTATQDQAKIALVFADEPPAERVETASAFNVFFAVPPGAKNYEVVANYTFREKGKLLSFTPHTHVRGTAFRYELVHQDGSKEIVLDLPNYDFNWQLDYILAEPIEVEAGTILRATAWYDNSADNPHNPDPTATVRFGEQTWDEMMIGYFDWIPLGRAAAEGR
jgi:hypothetical protein